MSLTKANVLVAGDGRIGRLGGLGVRFMIPGSDSAGGFSLVEHPLAPRALAAPLHRHSREDETASCCVVGSALCSGTRLHTGSVATSSTSRAVRGREAATGEFPFTVVIFLWVQAELIAMATDLAEFVGAALGLNLVFGIPLFVAGLLTGVLAFAILGLQAWGFRRLEATIAGLVGVIVVAFGLEVLRASPSWSGVLGGTFVPRLDGNASVLLAVGILGATVMPHVIYLHSALTQKRIVGANPSAKLKIFRFEFVDVMIAMGIAGLINMAMLTMAASVFHVRGLLNVGNDLGQVFTGLDHYVGAHSGIVFGIALLASGVSSSSVGTLAGQVVMQGFIHRKISIFLRRAITMVPAMIVIGIHFDPSRALVLSQVFLSFGIPFALVPLVMFCRNPKLMGNLVNHRFTSWAAYVVAAVIIGLNGFLLYQTFFPTA